MTDCYILDGHTPVPCPTIDVWGRRMHEADRIVARDELPGGIVVSTVFLGVDHNHRMTGPPVLFETMVFRGEHADECVRYHTWEEAEAGHREVVAQLRQSDP